MSAPLDLIIIGGGPIGLACGIEAKKRNLSYLIIEKGCLVNAIYNYPKNMTFFSSSDRLEIGGIPFISYGDKPTRREALDYYRRVKSSYELEVKLYEKVEHIDHSKEIFSIKTSKNTYFARNIVLSMGFYDIPALMNVKGEDLPKVRHYYDEPHPYSFQKVIVVGASNSAVDVALETYRKGAEVTMVVREHEIGQNVKYWVRPDIENRIKEGSIRAYFGSEILEIREESVDIRTPDGLKTLENDFVMAMTGYKPNYALLEMLEVQLSADWERKPIYNPDTQETFRKGVYVAGVVCGGMETHRWFIENSRIHAELIAEDIKRKQI
jgi:thioredoxin reductase (NADPH)